MTTSNKITLGLIFLLLGEVYADQISGREQHRNVILANVGETVTLTCFYQDSYVAYTSWYKQMLGDIPQMVSSQLDGTATVKFYNQFKSNPRFSVQRGKGINHLKISNLRLSDSATYYCGRSYFTVEFTTRVTLYVNGSESDTQMISQQPVFESVQPGNSVTLKCTVHTETCDGEHTSVNWFRRSGESQVQIFYTHHDGQCKENHGNKSDNCERIFKAGSSAQSCTYSLPMKNLTLSDAGTYYCAVASCGEILFGNRTKLDVEEEPAPLFLVYCLGAALAVSFILIIVLAYIIYKLKKKTCLQFNGQLRGSPLSPEAGGHDADDLHYVALSLSNKKNRPRRQRNNMERDTVYSGVRE